ncbi:sporulation histidine kinase inhibitor Sda [Jeotgalibacillus sp. ET6]|nr:sporulation histidine kinase inhibitor Sda [Jeotgalibacillus sp. ET6]MDG5471090.1 sporulation histidine kinase inhibitor Sda [Jeotgalibacillus sp. ET6]
MKSLRELSDEKLVESFEIAKQKELSNDFIKLLECEMKIRGIIQLVS